jgi:N-methylhydantoinase A
MLRIGVDIGGTFTDFVIYDTERKSITTFKLLSDNKNPSAAIIQGLNRTLGSDPAQIIHGSTVATNALLERKGSRTALITTRGFRDILQIGRQNRPHLYDWNQAPQPALVPADLRFEVNERINSHGEVIIPLDITQIEELSTHLDIENIESIAICLLFSFLYPSHEQKIAAALREKGYFVSVSSEILPEFREYERTSTTVVNAYVSPIIDRYLSELQKSLPDSNLQIMQSNGGMINLNEAKNNGARCILSGPAGGIIGAQFIAQQIISDEHKTLPVKKVKIITLDMGGTSTDVSLINGEPALTTNAIVAGCPIHLPLLDIHTIGSGGGSIAYVDPGGSLRVGPQSAGADPGPACYGKGDLPTVTDANLVLGRLRPDYFLGGQLTIYPVRAYAAVSKLGSELNLTPVQTAYGIIEVVNIQMERALRVISVEHGHDPREFNLFSYGGAGGLHAIELARHLGIPKVIISKFSSTLSAFGMLASNVIKDYVHTIMLDGIISFDRLDRYFSPIVAQGIQDVKNQGIPEDHIEIQRSLDIRYVGQSYELNIPFFNNFLDIFHETHSSTYGYSYSDKPIEIVNIRLRAIGKVPTIWLKSDSDIRIDTKPTVKDLIPVEMRDGIEYIPMYIYEQLSAGTRFDGPALILSADTTILVNHMDHITVDVQHNLLIDVNLADHAP